MSFFKQYDGTMNKRLARLETLIWTLIYGGLLSALVGWFMQDGGDADGYWLMVAGAIVALVGFILILVRARMNEGPDAAGQAPAGKRPSR
jgi:vacuolar-type H+-ATPase subunit I/STV1